MVNEPESRVVFEMPDVVPVAREEIVKAKHFVTVRDQGVAEV
jgi:hypothetical protein